MTNLMNSCLPKYLKWSVRVSFIFILMFSLTSCGVNQYLSEIDNEKTIDARLVGEWKGGETGHQFKDTTKEWIMTRNSDGTFLLDFRVTSGGITQKYEESGNWWVENGLFHEFHEYSGKTDLYEYKLLNNDQVKFKAISSEVEHDNTEEAYEFIDTKISSAPNVKL